MLPTLSTFWKALSRGFEGFLETLDINITPTFRDSEELEKELTSHYPSISRDMKFRLPSHRSFSSGTVSDAVSDNIRRCSLSSTEIGDLRQSDRLVFPSRPTQRIGHCFNSIPLEADTFCDFCACPIYSLGSEPICQRCADCNITCHPQCVYEVRISCHRDLHAVPPSDCPEEVVVATSHGASGTEKLLDRQLEKLSIENGACSYIPLSATSDLPPATESMSETLRNTCDTLHLDHTIYYTAVSSHDQVHSASLPSFITPKPQNDDHLAGQSPHPSNVVQPDRGRVPRLRNVRKTGPVKLTSRHSFLAGNRSNAPLSSRLAYDFSSLDRKSIVTHGIEVQKVTCADEQRACDFEPIPEGSMSDAPSTPVPKTSSNSITSSNSEFGYASVMQSTAAYLKDKPRRAKMSGYTPSPSPTLYPVLIGPRGRLPYSVDELHTRLSVFNANEFGLQSRITPRLPPGECEGQVRIHINLLRPIRMLLTLRPVSIFDLVGQENELNNEDDWYVPQFETPVLPKPVPSQQVRNGVIRTQPKSSVVANAPTFASDANAPLKAVRRRFSKRLLGSHPQSATFWLPRGSTKLLYVRLSTTVKSVITMLLDRFQIADSPQKFALYEHTIEGEHRVSVRKLFDDESPLGLVLRWTEGGLDRFNELLGIKRLVLQENETGDIEWSGFSVPELNTFLSILNHEEADYRRRIELKYEAKRKEVLRLMAQYEQAVATVSGTHPELSGPSMEHLTEEDTAHEDACAMSSTSTTPTHSPKPPRKSTSTLPGLFFAQKKNTSTLFKPSEHKRMKKAEKAREKVEKERLKAEAKKLKAEAKQQGAQNHPRRLFTFTGRPSLPSGTATTTPLK